MPRGPRAKTPLLLQMEATECGAAALGMILGYHRKFVPLATLRHECGVSRDGSKASSIVAAARRYGMVAKGFSKRLDQVRDVRCPFIAFWQFNHFVTVEGFDAKRVYLNDPAFGHRVLTWKEFDEGFTGVVLTFEPGPDFVRDGRPPRVLPALRRRFSGEFAAIAFCVIAGILMVIPELVLPACSQVFLDAVILEGRIGWFRPLLVAMVVTTLVHLGLDALQLRCLRRMSVSLAARLKGQFVWHLLRLPVGFFAQRYAGDIVSRAELNDAVASTLTGELVRTIIALVNTVIIGAALLYYDWLLTLIGTLSVIFNFLLLRWTAARRVEANMRISTAEGKLGAGLVAGIEGIETVKASGGEDGLFEQFAGRFATVSNARQQFETSSQRLRLLPEMAAAITGTLVLIVGGWHVIEGVMSLGMLFAFQALMSRFLRPVTELMGLAGRIQEMHGQLMRLDDVLDNPVSPDFAPADAAGAAADRLTGAIELRNVTFGYNPREAPIVEEVSFQVAPGARVALVGGSGSGKSTLAKLLCGFYRPWSGEILLDGCPLDQTSRDAKTSSLAFVEQDVLTFEGSVRDNLSLWDDTVSVADLQAACRDAAILDIIAGLPGGYEASLLERGANLSGGQRQRLEIARALVRNPTILVLDEATSALDPETERVVNDHLRRRGCTCVIVAHRLSTIRDCDEILVMSRGRIVERGTHEQLRERDGEYRRLLALSEDDEQTDSGSTSTDAMTAPAAV